MSAEARYCYITINALKLGFSTQNIIASDIMFPKLLHMLDRHKREGSKGDLCPNKAEMECQAE